MKKDFEIESFDSMKNLYYLYWADSINSFRKFNPKRKDWKVAVYFLNTWINALNLWIILIWLKFFNIFSIQIIDIKIFPGRILNEFISFSIVFAAPFAIIKYFLVFYKNKYTAFVNEYPDYHGKFAFKYSLSIVLLALSSGIIYSSLK